MLGSASFPTDEAGYRSLVAWLESFGPVARVGVEGTGAYGATLARHLAARRLPVVEVDRPNRQQRRRRGKSDPLDALAAARAVLSGEATGVPKAGDGPVEAIRVLRIARRSAASQRIEALNQLRALVVTCHGPLRQRLTSTTCYQRVERAAALRPGLPDGPASATRWALRTLARRIRNLETELDQLDYHLEALARSYAPDLLACFGVGVGLSPAPSCAPPATTPRVSARRPPSPTSVASPLFPLPLARPSVTVSAGAGIDKPTAPSGAW
jgi:transposase